MTRLRKATVEALGYKAEVAAESYDPTDPESVCWLETEIACRSVEGVATVDALRASKTACDELENYLMGDRQPQEKTAIIADLCRAGYCELYDPTAIVTRRIKTRTVDGTRYVVGH